ncbi:unnamed protein product [Soboliphyme baturini]|uniref:Secreted protein n=1 Tax=Soboliphyme baturini TaxID=241478 RepID=A0A183IPF7_9BILA|nr:unnamed protein product [Soboliphyme baturini]
MMGRRRVNCVVVSSSSSSSSEWSASPSLPVNTVKGKQTVKVNARQLGGESNVERYCLKQAKKPPAGRDMPTTSKQRIIRSDPIRVTSHRVHASCSGRQAQVFVHLATSSTCHYDDGDDGDDERHRRRTV